MGDVRQYRHSFLYLGNKDQKEEEERKEIGGEEGGGRKEFWVRMPLRSWNGLDVYEGEPIFLNKHYFHLCLSSSLS